MADKSLLEPVPFAVHIMASCDVVTNDWDAVLHLLGRLKPRAVANMARRHLFYVCAQGMAAHHANREKFIDDHTALAGEEY